MTRRVVPSVSASLYGMFGHEVLRWGPYTPSRTGTVAGVREPSLGRSLRGGETFEATQGCRSRRVQGDFT